MLKDKIALLTLTDRGLETARRIEECLPQSAAAEFYVHVNALGCGRERTGVHIFQRLRDVVPGLWPEYEALIFIMAAGIVVRQIAFLLEGKDRDPAVLVLDEEGKFVIPLLSGHLGGANDWARRISACCGAVPVITTATDGRNILAPDQYARLYGWKIEPLRRLPALNRLLLDQHTLNVWTEYQLSEEYAALRQDPHYHFLAPEEKEKAHILISAFPDLNSKEDVVCLIPPVLSVGVGCRRGVSKEAIMEQIQEGLKQIGASAKALAGIYSIERKAAEAGLQEAAKALGVLLKTFTADELQVVSAEEGLSASDFVREKIGVEGVCEAASLLGIQRKGRLILSKSKGRGVTVAVSLASSLSWASDREILNI